MKNFILGALAMLVLFIGGYLVFAPGEEIDAAGAEGDSQGGARAAAQSGNGGTLVFIGGEEEAARALEEAAAEAEEAGAEDGEPSVPEPQVTARPTAIAERPTAVPGRRVCNGGPYVVFFSWDSSEITPEAANTLNAVAEQYAINCQGANVMVAGHTDRANDAGYAVSLSQRMAGNVARYLEGQGIPGGRISTESYGEARPRIETADGVRELQNRRVEITFGG